MKDAQDEKRQEIVEMTKHTDEHDKRDVFQMQRREMAQTVGRTGFSDFENMKCIIIDASRDKSQREY